MLDTVSKTHGGEEMRRLLKLSVGGALAILAISGNVQAQDVNKVYGTIQAADCSANTLTLNASDGVHTFTASSATAVYVGSAASSFCALSRSIGSQATVWFTANGDQVLAGRVDVTQSTEAPRPQASAPSNSGPSNSGPSNSGPFNYGCTPFPSLYYGPYYGYYGPLYYGTCVYPFHESGGERR